MKRRSLSAGMLSLLVPGLGQIYLGQGAKGGVILAAAILIGNLNIIVLLLIALANPEMSLNQADAISIWRYWIPRVVHDIVSVWSIVFWFWAVWDAFTNRQDNK